MRTSPRILTGLAVVTVIAGALTATAGATPAPTAPTLDTACHVPAQLADAATASLAKAERITPAQAQERMTRQQSASAAAPRFAAAAGASFAGLWIAGDGTDAVTIGVTRAPAATRSAVRDVAARCGVGTLRVVTVAHSLAELDAASQWVSTELASSKSDAGSVIGVDVATNRVEAQLAPTTSAARLAAVTQAARARYGSMVSVVRGAAAPTTAACAGNFCDPPLRGGIEIHGPNARPGYITLCSSGFVARSRSDGKYYLMTAGHCGVVGSAWTTEFASPTSHPIGAMHNRTFASAGDYGIITVNNPTGWSLPRGYVFVRQGSDTARNETYPIHRAGGSVQGMRICKSGRTTGTTCGVVTRLGVTVTYTDGPTVRGLGEASFCLAGGDSGGSVFASGTAYGLVSGQSGSCNAFYQGITAAANALGVSVVTS